jgi:hypothetical protein
MNGTNEQGNLEGISGGTSLWQFQRGKEVPELRWFAALKPGERRFGVLGAAQNACAARSWRRSANGGWRAGSLGATEDNVCWSSGFSLFPLVFKL